ncbi:MAG: glycoside hydrolase family 3 C-terminal domain-containing protein [Actinobacteria bacterium]|nr:glycoside hydrolase family 3 C-terminal domain-containing protein [Actinomycetota bacterium]
MAKRRLRGSGMARGDENRRAASASKRVAWTAVLESEGREREEALRALVSGMSLRKKTRQMSGHMKPWEMLISLARYNYRPFRSGADRRLGIPPIRFTDGPRGVSLDHSTCFPVSMARGATWDVALEERIGEAMGVEARSQEADFLGAVCINLLRHPGWGRAQETYGEDPYLLGEMGAAMVRGLQKHVMACVKHFACNSIECSRFRVDVRVDERALREVYLPHFKRCVDEGAAAVMSAYNRVNGAYCAHNSHLLRDILKGEWGFRGLVMSDFVLGTRDTVKAALGGLDIEMPHTFHFGRRLRRAVRDGRVPMSVVDEAVTRILRQKARFAETGTRSDYGRRKVACREHVALALEAARKSVVLLKNEGGALPLRSGEIRSLAVIGRLADLANLGDHGSSRVRPPYAVTVLEGLRERAGDEVRIDYRDGGDLEEASRAARNADACVVVVGLTARDEGEYMPWPVKAGGDREDLSLRPRDVRLLEVVAKASPRCIVVLEGGSAVLTSGWRDEVEAVLVAWYPGMEGGNAVADIIFGEVNPCGKLPVTFPEDNEQLPPFDKKARSLEYGYYHGYRLFDKQGMRPAFPFGFGLSYTTYEYRDLRLSAEEMSPEGSLRVEAEVANTGGMAGEEVVQLYVAYPSSRVERPVKELKGFARVRLAPGESRSVPFLLRACDLAYYDAEKGRWEVEETTYRLFAGSSSRPEDLHLQASFRIKNH